MGYAFLILFLALIIYTFIRVSNYWFPNKPREVEHLFTPKPKEKLPALIEPETFEAPEEKQIVINHNTQVNIINIDKVIINRNAN